MEDTRFDALAKSLTAGHSRRGITRLLGRLVLSGPLVSWLGLAESEAKKKKKKKKCVATAHLCKDMDGVEFCCPNTSFCCPGPGGDPADGLTGRCCRYGLGLECCPDGSCLLPEFPCLGSSEDVNAPWD